MHYSERRFLQNIGRFLPSESEPVLSKARRINELASLCARFLPAALARHARAANLKDGTLVILADNPAVAAKLKLLCESLGAYIAKQRPEVNSVSVRVQPSLAAAQDPLPRKKCELSTATLDELQPLQRGLVDSPATRALASLIQHHDPRAKPQPASRKKRSAALGAAPAARSPRRVRPNR